MLGGNGDKAIDLRSMTPGDQDKMRVSNTDDADQAQPVEPTVPQVDQPQSSEPNQDQIMRLLIKISDEQRDGDEILKLIENADNQEDAIRMVVDLLDQINFTTEARDKTIQSITRRVLSDPDKYLPTMKALILYKFKNKQEGNRFWKHPDKDEYLFVDNDGELISFEGSLQTLELGPEKRKQEIIQRLGQYQILSGPNRGKTFRGDQNQGELYARPIDLNKI